MALEEVAEGEMHVAEDVNRSKDTYATLEKTKSLININTLTQCDIRTLKDTAGKTM